MGRALVFCFVVPKIFAPAVIHPMSLQLHWNQSLLTQYDGDSMPTRFGKGQPLSFYKDAGLEILVDTHYLTDSRPALPPGTPSAACQPV